MVDFPASHVSFLGVQISQSCVRSPGAFLMPCGYDQTVSACHTSFLKAFGISCGERRVNDFGS